MVSFLIPTRTRYGRMGGEENEYMVAPLVGVHVCWCGVLPSDEVKLCLLLKKICLAYSSLLVGCL